MAETGSPPQLRPLRVRLFGTPHVSYDDRPVRFVAARTLPLFVYLLLGRDRPIARDRLAYTLWPDSSEVEARANLRRHLHRVNGPLQDVSGHRWFEADDKAIAFGARLPLELDVAQLEAACANPAEAAGAVDLYASDLFEGCDEEWLLPHRERLRTSYLGMLFGLIDRYRGERRFAEAIALSRKALHVDPFREDAVRTLMTLHATSGDRASALADYRTFRERLQRELGADPMHETQSLHDAIRRYATVGASEPDRPVADRALPFEGREDEIETLRHTWRLAAGGQGRVAMVSGETGIGKSRLLREFATIAEREGARVLWGASSAPEAAPYEPVTEALAGAIGEIARLALSPALASALAVRFPELRAMRADVSENVELADQRERERFFDAIALAIDRLCATRPTVLVLEDVHDVLADTFELVARIARTCARSPLLIMLSFREEQMSRALRSFRLDASMKRAVRVGLGRLEPAACHTMLERRSSALPAAVRAWAIERAKGNPLFLSELVREYDARGAGGSHEPGTLPATLDAAILARFENLSQSARSLVDIAAVGGTIVSIDLLQQACGWPLAEVLDGTDELVDRFVLRETATGARGDYEFAHELIRDVVLRSMPSVVRARRHRRFAKAILHLFSGREDDVARTLAQHFEAAGEPDDAARFYARAANVANARFAWQDAIALASDALRLERRPRERYAAHAAIECAAAKCGDGAWQSLAITAMFAVADELADEALRATALGRSSELGLQTGDFERQRRATEELEAIATSSHDMTLLHQTLRCRARGEIALGRPAAAALTMRAIEAMPGLARTPSERIEDLRVRAHAHADAAEFDAALAATAEAEREAGLEAALGDRVAIVRTRATIAVEMADRAEAARLAPILLALCEEIGDVEGRGNAHQVAARIDWWTFAVASARTHLRAGAAIFERIGKLQSRASIAINAGALENHVGRLDDAERFYAEALAHAERLESAPLRALCHANFAYVALLRGDGARALAQAERALSLARETQNLRLIAITLGHRGSALRQLGRDENEIVACFEEALALCGRFGFADERLELLVELLPALVARGDAARAKGLAVELERAIAADASAVVLPVEALVTAAAAFDAAGEGAVAHACHDRARTLLRERLAALPDDETREAYSRLRGHGALLGATATATGLRPSPR